MAKSFDFDSLGGVLQGSADNDRSLARFASSGRAVPWTTPLTTTGTQPTVTSYSAFYVVQNNVFNGWFNYNLTAGGTGFNVLTVPPGVTIPTIGVSVNSMPSGRWLGIGASGAINIYGDLVTNSPTVFVFAYPTSFTAATLLSGTSISGITVLQGNVCFRVPDSFNP